MKRKMPQLPLRGPTARYDPCLCLLEISLSINPLKETELILYGGEFYNGNKTFVYGDLYRYDVEKQDWKLISSPNSPPPCSAHQAVIWKNYLYIFGGEFTSPNQERFHHYKDFWMLDLKTNQWEQLNLKGSPSPRSGHRMRFFYKHLYFWYHNDLFVFDLDQFKWQEITPRPGSLWPSARSGFQFFVYQDEIFLYGGYSKEVSSDKTGSEKGIVHSDLWSLDPRTWEWNKVKKNGMPPGPRAGFSMCVHKKRAMLFGGVVDMEVGGDVMMSLFLDELYGFQLDNHRWYPLELRKAKSTKDKPKKSSGRKRKNDDKINSIEPEESADDFERKVDGISHQMAKTITVGNDPLADKYDGKIHKSTANMDTQDKSDGKIHESTANMDTQDSDLPEVVKPCGRINSCMVVGRDTLYVYGGMMEVKDREITLNDLYSLNLSKLDEWKCIIPATETEWVEGSKDEDEDEDDDDDSEDEGDEDSNSDETDDDNDEESGKDGSIQMGDAVALIKGEGKSLRRKEKRPGETLREFYKRTNMYWQMAAHEHTQHTGKELRKDGFDLAEARYRELKPILDELAILEAEQKAEEQEPETSTKKKARRKDKRFAMVHTVLLYRVYFEM
ncbi:kelch domain-containing protein 4-like [Pyrus ussuriensis x Pyrus communis]|uniref:Kelch domain-containing protein 4-like n=1 Tax=Pyrus ussuriensis x Pyrus communis TaxID=2448454 RepID=A0A5N5G703_9ROSA|nr:kelch domain-containing protein 4-like [Pyrus ussuriensis x Pyrus communis]